MAFAFSAAPAPAAPAPAAAGGFGGFGSPAPAAPGAPAKSPAPAFGGFGAPAPAPAFGAPAPAAPAPAPGGLFGAPAAAPAPAAGGFGFGTPTPAPAPAFGAPAPAAAGFGFGAATPAPAAFGAPAAPAPAFGAPPAAPPQQQAQQQQPQYLTGHTPYSSLPPAARKMVDDVHALLTAHQRDLATVGSMAPALLHLPPGSGVGVGGLGMGRDAGIAPADVAGGSPARPRGASTTSSSNTNIDPNRTPLPAQISALSTTVSAVSAQLESCLSTTAALKSDAEKLAVQGIRYGSWPVEALAARRGVQLSALSTDQPPAPNPATAPGTPSIKAPGQSHLESTLHRQLTDMAAGAVDRIEHLPSPYLWEVLHELEGRTQDLANRIDVLRRQLHTSELARGGGHGGGIGAFGGDVGGGGGSGRMLPPLLGMAAFGDGMGSGGTSLVNYNPNPV